MKVAKLANKEQALAFASFLAAERNRHLEDVKHAETDLKRLAAIWDIEIPWDNTYFIVVREDG